MKSKGYLHIKFIIGSLRTIITKFYVKIVSEVSKLFHSRTKSGASEVSRPQISQLSTFQHFCSEKKQFESDINNLINSFKSKHPYLTLTSGDTYKAIGEIDAIEFFKLHHKVPQKSQRL